MVSFNHWLSSIKPIRCQSIRRWLTLTMLRATGPRSLGTESVSRLTLKPWMSQCACAILFTSRSDLTRHEMGRIEVTVASRLLQFWSLGLRSSLSSQSINVMHMRHAYACVYDFKYRVFSHDVTAAILVSQDNETAAMLVSQANLVGIELFSYANAFFCSNKFA